MPQAVNLFERIGSMRRLVLGVLALTMVLFCTTDVDAFWGHRARARRAARACNSYTAYNTGYSNYGYVGNSSFSGNAQAIAEQKVAMLAAAGYGYHPGGYVSSFEGWGMGPTPEAARWNTCNGANCQSAAGSATAWSEAAQTYFAINIWEW